MGYFVTKKKLLVLGYLKKRARCNQPSFYTNVSSIHNSTSLITSL